MVDKTRIKKFLAYNGKNHSYKKLNGWLEAKKWAIKDDRVLNDASSPTGKVYIGLAKNPLTKVKNGFGFYGVLSQTNNREFVQCHICGKWVRKINNAHLKGHKISYKDYKKKFGLQTTTALIPDSVSYHMEETTRKWMFEKFKDPEFKRKYIERMQKIGLKANKQNIGNNFSARKIESAEHNNNYNLCNEQLKYRIIQYLKKYRFLPTGSTKGEADNIVHALITRHGSRNLGFKHYGFPTFFKSGTRVEMTAADGAEFTFSYAARDYDREKVYDWIIKHTPIIAA